MTISVEERARLVDLARKSVESAVANKPRPQLADPSGVLAEHRGCFVTLTNGNDLRGCIGTFYPQGPLWQMIIEMGHEAARDPRFTMNPITPAELPQLTVEVSVLSPLESTSEPEKLEVGKHGIYIIRGGRAGCFLPEVATDQGWNAEEFLSYCCSHKAGLPADAWKKTDTKVFLFTSEKFSK